jgi:RHS repeat-associated protein
VWFALNSYAWDRANVHSPRGIHAQQSPAGAWTHPLQDGLGSVRGVVEASGALVEVVTYAPFGEPDTALTATPFAFTGEMRDGSGLQYHRARYYAPRLGVFPSLDPFEGSMARPMSLNGYAWVEGNVSNRIDYTGTQTTGTSTGIGTNIGGSTGSLYDLQNSVIVWQNQYQQAQLYQYQSSALRYADYPYDNYDALTVITETNYLVLPRIVETSFGFTDTSRIGELGYLYPSYLLNFNGQCLNPALFGPGPSPYLSVVRLQPITNVQTSFPGGGNSKPCDPQVFADWWQSLQDAPPGGTGNSASYENRVARGVGTEGTTKKVPTGATTSLFGNIFQFINADGATRHNCHIIEGKWDGGGQFRVDNPPPWLRDDNSVNSVQGELLRYRMAVISNSEPVALEIRTNTTEARDFFLLQLVEYGFAIGIDAFVNVIP